MDLDFLLNQVKHAIFNNPTTPHQPGHDPGGLIGSIEGLFGNFRGQQPQGDRQILPASQDPLGDPGLTPGPLGANYGYADNGNVRPASEDPLGDPADLERRW